MKLKIVSLKGTSEHHVVWIEVNTPDGNSVIQPQHSPTTFVLLPGKEVIYCLTTGKLETITITREALLSVTRSSATLLLN